ncbi:UNVERIFIED_CONTAM: hypothetical protein K2H54_054370 [Gekko kuhli]
MALNKEYCSAEGAQPTAAGDNEGWAQTQIWRLGAAVFPSFDAREEKETKEGTLRGLASYPAERLEVPWQPKEVTWEDAANIPKDAGPTTRKRDGNAQMSVPCPRNGARAAQAPAAMEPPSVQEVAVTKSGGTSTTSQGGEPGAVAQGPV